jgi:hypothetical protein
MRSSGEQARARRKCFEQHKWNDEGGKLWLTCCYCQGRIDPATQKWEAAHQIRHSLTADNEPRNVKPAHYVCHRETVPDDTKAAAKDVRVNEKHYGIKRKRGFGNQWRKSSVGTRTI